MLLAPCASLVYTSQIHRLSIAMNISSATAGKFRQQLLQSEAVPQKLCLRALMSPSACHKKPIDQDTVLEAAGRNAGHSKDFALLGPPRRYRSSASASPFLDNLSSCASWREPLCQHLPSRHVAAQSRPEQRCAFASGTMPLIYAFVSRGTTVLADYTSYTGNFSTVAIQCLEKCPTDNSKFTFTCDRHTFNYLVDGGFSKHLLSAVVLCVMECRLNLPSSAQPSLW